MELLELTLGQRIKTMRTIRQLKQSELAEQAKVSAGFLSDLENGKRDVSTKRLIRICNVIDCSPNLLLTGKE
jgi:transcriptional regulator with XRE-family HTH domain